jgi:hypothetical protein
VHYWKSLPQDDDELTNLNVEALQDLFEYCSIKLSDEDAEVRALQFITVH